MKVDAFSSASKMLDPAMANYIADRPNYSGRTALDQVLTKLAQPNHHMI